METTLKKRILSFIENHNDGSEETKELISKMKDELRYADCSFHCVSVDDLNNLSLYYKNELRKKLNKKSEDAFTLQDCEKVAEAISEITSEEFGENITNAIILEL